MVARLLGHIDWGLEQDSDGHRDYTIDWLIKQDTAYDGPGLAMRCPGLPQVGTHWTFGNETDNWAFCHPEQSASPVLTAEPGHYWVVRQLFSTRPIKRCQDQSIQNPMMEPPRISGSFNKVTRERVFDRFGQPILSSSLELLRGSSVEFDDNQPTVNIGLNLLSLPLSSIAQMQNVVNSTPLWGLPPRTIKLSNARWQRLLYGTCNYFYTVEYDFDINYNTWDRYIADEGSRCLKGWMPGTTFKPMNPTENDPSTGEERRFNPLNFEVYKDKTGENSRVFLDGMGRPALKLEDVAQRKIEAYTGANLLLLGIPASLD